MLKFILGIQSLASIFLSIIVLSLSWNTSSISNTLVFLSFCLFICGCSSLFFGNKNIVVFKRVIKFTSITQIVLMAVILAQIDGSGVIVGPTVFFASAMEIYILKSLKVIKQNTNTVGQISNV